MERNNWIISTPSQLTCFTRNSTILSDILVAKCGGHPKAKTNRMATSNESFHNPIKNIVNTEEERERDSWQIPKRHRQILHQQACAKTMYKKKIPLQVEETEKPNGRGADNCVHKYGQPKATGDNETKITRHVQGLLAPITRHPCPTAIWAIQRSTKTPGRKWKRMSTKSSKRK